MKKVVWLLVCCVACFALVSCSNDEGSGETSAQKETAEVPEATEEVAEVPLAGTWEITEWKADHINQMEMWKVQSVTVEFGADGSVESKLAYNDGDERVSKGTWKRYSNMLEIVVKGGGGEDGDEPFERTREFVVDELSTASLVVHAEIGPTDKPIIVSYKAKRMP